MIKRTDNETNHNIKFIWNIGIEIITTSIDSTKKNNQLPISKIALSHHVSLNILAASLIASFTHFFSNIIIGNVKKLDIAQFIQITFTSNVPINFAIPFSLFARFSINFNITLTVADTIDHWKIYHILSILAFIKLPNLFSFQFNIFFTVDNIAQLKKYVIKNKTKYVKKINPYVIIFCMVESNDFIVFISKLNP